MRLIVLLYPGIRVMDLNQAAQFDAELLGLREVFERALG
jgi:hypothetical protein